MTEVLVIPEELYNDEYAICPYCEHKHEDVWEWHDGEFECDGCERLFLFHASHSTTYITRAKPKKVRGAK